LLLLACGEALAETATAKEGESSNALIGTLLMCFYAGLSGLAGVFTERMLKKNNVMSFWMKQIMLYFWGSVITFIGMIITDGSAISENGILFGYTPETWLVVFLLSFGGLLVSAVITQFDNIVKGIGN
jgi:UDP-sugar transporter A1/2/3